MTAQSQSVNQAEVLFNDYKLIIEKMYQTSSLEELKQVSGQLEEKYHALLTVLRLLRKEQKSDFDRVSKDMIHPISTFKSVIRENYERLDPTYNYEQGVLEENED